MLAKKSAVIGAGPMGLMVAYELAKAGHSVTLFERDDRIGGMSASFDLGGTQIERFYHFVCGTDDALFALLKELNLLEKLIFRETKMGFYYQGSLYPWADPISLLKFPKLDLISKIRYGLHVLYNKRIQDWTKLDKMNATPWLKKWLGQKAYDVLWEPLFRLKFYEYQHDLSAAWIGARIRRMAQSRKSFFKEALGYIEGGSETLLNALEQQIIKRGGQIRLQANVTEVVAAENKVQGIKIDNEFLAFDDVITTIPLPYIPKLVPQLPEALRQTISNITNIGVACVVLKLKQSFSPYFWMNVNDPAMEIPGMIEYSNLNPSVGHVLYVPYYMPQTHPKYKMTNEAFIEEVCRYLKKINTHFSEQWISASHVARYGYAQTVCTPDFFSKLPAMRTPIKGFYMADTASYYPEDRSITESLAIGKQLARQSINDACEK